MLRLRNDESDAWISLNEATKPIFRMLRRGVKVGQSPKPQNDESQDKPAEK